MVPARAGMLDMEKKLARANEFKEAAEVPLIAIDCN